MILGPVVEGMSEERVLPIILRWLRIKHRPPLRAEGKQDLFERAVDFAALHLDRGADSVLFMFDADGPDGLSEWERLLARLPEGHHHGFVPVHMLEAWLLADLDAVSAVVGAPVERVTRTETLSNPASTLDRMFRNAGHAGYLKAQHAREIAGKSSEREWRSKCPSYVRGLAMLGISAEH